MSVHPLSPKKISPEEAVSVLCKCESDYDYQQLNDEQTAKVISLVFSPTDELVKYEMKLAKRREHSIIYGFIREFFQQKHPRNLAYCPKDISNFVVKYFSEPFKFQGSIIIKHAIELIKYQKSSIRASFYFYSILKIELIREYHLDDLIESAGYISKEKDKKNALNSSFKCLMLSIKAVHSYNDNYDHSGKRIETQKIAKKLGELSKEPMQYNKEISNKEIKMMFDEKGNITEYGKRISRNCWVHHQSINTSFYSHFFAIKPSKHS